MSLSAAGGVGTAFFSSPNGTDNVRVGSSSTDNNMGQITLLDDQNNVGLLLLGSMISKKAKVEVSLFKRIPLMINERFDHKNIHGISTVFNSRLRGKPGAK